MIEFQECRTKPSDRKYAFLTEDNAGEILEYIKDKGGKAVLKENLTKGEVLGLGIQTLEGEMMATVGNYVIEGTEGEFWYIKKSIFEDTYDYQKVNEELEEAFDEGAKD